MAVHPIGFMKYPRVLEQEAFVKAAVVSLVVRISIVLRLLQTLAGMQI